MSRLGSAVCALLLLPALAHAQAPTRYSLANGCWTAVDAGGRGVAETVRLKATALGRYLLYRPDGTFVTAASDGALAPHARSSMLSRSLAGTGDREVDAQLALLCSLPGARA